MAFGYRHYVPILKGKRAEFCALGSLADAADMTPLIEAVPSNPPVQTPQRMSDQWTAERDYFIDLLFFDDPDDATTPATEEHPVLACFAEAASRGQNAIPVTGLARSPGFQSAIQQVVASQGKGIAFRLTSDDFEDADELESTLKALPEFFGLEAHQVDLILDIGSIVGSSVGTVSQIHRANIDLIPDLDEWRTLTVSSSAFPLGLGPLVRDEWNTVPRVDWRGWRALVTGSKKPSRIPAYSDYTIAQPALPAEGIATILAQLRYTINDAWIVWKGRNAITEGFDQFFGICEDLVARPEFRGAAFSWGDGQIAEKAATGGSSGNAQTWRQIGTSHHLETVLDQIANLP